MVTARTIRGMAEERRLVTVLFGDVVGSTSLGESMDAEDLRRLLGRFYEIATNVVREHGGILEKFIGDAAMAIFGLAQAHDDDARRALDAALDLRARLRSDAILADRLPIRIGLNTGEVVASRDPERQDFLVTGDAVNVAARLQQAAEPWQILASARTASADLGAHEFGPEIDLDLKGKSASVRARVLVGRASVVERRHTPLVGREADLAQLDLVARRTFAEHRPYLVTLIAPAGTGKSRLVEEFLTGLETLTAPPQVAMAQCLPYGQRLSYWPLRALLFGIVGLDEEASPEEARHRIRAWLEQVGAERPDTVAELLAATIGASEADALDRTVLFSAWRRTLELAAEQRPLVLVIEDLHWSSDSLLDLIESVLQPRADSPMLVIALARPELLERRPSWGGGRRNHVSLALEPLDDASIGQLVGDLLEEAAPELRSIVIERSEGNPFYAGEIVRSLLERGVDLADGDALRAAAASLPDTVQATVLARLDRLEPGARRVLQLASVLGRSFSGAGLSAIDDAEAGADVIDSMLEQLVDRELIRPSGRDRYTFRHIIIRDVAYGTMPRAERAVLHAAAGRWLETAAVGREDELAELVAFHFREATTLGSAFEEADAEVRAAAVRWLLRAAEVSATGRALLEAAGHLAGAIELAPPAEQPAIYERLAQLYGSGDLAVQAYARAWQVGEAEGLPASFLLRNLSRQLMVITRWFASVARPVEEGDIHELIARGDGWLANADEHSRATFLIACAALPFWLRQAGKRLPTDQEYRDADARAGEGLALAEKLDDPMLISAALDAMTSTVRPDWHRALQLSQRRKAMGERLPFDERMDALNMVAWASAVLGDLPEVVRTSQVAMDLIEPGQTNGFALAGASWNSYARALQGQWEALVSSIESLRHVWMEGDRPAAAYALQGFLSGIDWARNRGDDQRYDRWRAIAEEIIGRFPDGHPVAAMAAVSRLDLPGIAAIVSAHERFPDRIHYLEHALALCADHRQAVPEDVLDLVLARARSGGMRVMGAQGRRLRGLLASNRDDLAGALGEFTEMGAGRYTARVRVELGSADHDPQLMEIGRKELEALGEADLPTVIRAIG
jgi:class 3 adenylate cyclase